MTESEPTQQSTGMHWTRRLIIGLIVLLLLVLIVTAYARNWVWSGIPDKSIWQWMEILLVPSLLLFVGESLRRAEHNRQESEKQREQFRQEFEALEARRRNEERYREETVRKYFDDMAYLMVKEGLLELVQSVEPEKPETNEDSGEPTPPLEPDPEKLVERLKNPVWRMAQTRTITVLRRMAYQRIVDNDSSSESTVDVQRVNEILDFLRDTKLITGVASLLYNANLRNINLQGADLRGVNLSHSALDRADLSGAQLQAANLSNVEMRSANLSHAVCSETNLYEAHLSSANLIGANLGSAILCEATLILAELNNAILPNAILTNAKLDGAKMPNADLSGADLSGAILAGANLSEAIIEKSNFDSRTALPDSTFIKFGDEGKPIYDKYYDPNLGPQQMERYTNPNHPDFWQPEWVKQQANNNDEDT